MLTSDFTTSGRRAAFAIKQYWLGTQAIVDQSNATSKMSLDRRSLNEAWQRVHDLEDKLNRARAQRDELQVRLQEAVAVITALRSTR